ncbi:hypothetical protein GCM10027277_12930 [Pseudoduganella ginsengisoli]|uniref:PEP-CTERM sorting domain-containing protein n=1 Tax=Pseudoduganella ginsengisoli TaxID=1462440 RepID=A0A6L6PYA6_9BURK|nr:PEP-CTERM sorting domain-containing protein [Pseudoduganella ginsengisoli]MTW01682.1 PEP-CTERM sorting domain-containing protein [Pseudoduganella ginsengisoli]
MKKMLTMLAWLLGVWAAQASAGVVTFDDLPGDYTQAIADGYQGFNWTNMNTIRADALPGSGYQAGTVSQTNTAFNRDGGTVAISKAGPGTFDFVGAFFTSAWLDQEIALEGYADGQLLYSTAESFVLDTVNPLWVQLGWGGIDTLVIYSSSGTQWAMDNMTVPEPPPLALLGAAALAMTVARRRRT